MKTSNRQVIPIFLILFANTIGLSQEIDKDDISDITGCYTNLRYFPDSGDLGGVEFTILWSTEGYYVLVQWAEGGPEAPELVKGTITGNSIRFSITIAGGETDEFTGTVINKVLVGRFKNGTLNPLTGKQEFRLPRKMSYWQK